MSSPPRGIRAGSGCTRGLSPLQSRRLGRARIGSIVDENVAPPKDEAGAPAATARTASTQGPSSRRTSGLGHRTAASLHGVDRFLPRVRAARCRRPPSSPVSPWQDLEPQRCEMHCPFGHREWQGPSSPARNVTSALSRAWRQMQIVKYWKLSHD